MNGENAKGRVVAVVGRPNVGKSALFNRIARKRAAIVHDQSGVTRDRLMLEVEREGKTFNLVDTGGVTMASREDDFAGDIRAQVEAALQDAAVVIMTVDVQSGLTPLDEEVAAMVRKADVPCVLAINKCDLPRHESRAEEFARLGMKSFTVSAEHGTGITELVDAVMPYLPETINETIANPLRVAVVGRPNAGKSSYINRLLHSDRLIVSDVAGTTRDSIDVPFTVGSGKSARHYVLVDTAGMRNRHKCDSAVERFSLFRSEEAVRNCDIAVLVLDPLLGPTAQDKHIAKLIADNNKGCIVLMNKWDLAQEREMTQAKAEPVLKKIMPFLSHCPIVFASAKSGFNIRRSIDAIDAVAAQIQMKLPTGMLNRTLEEATRRTVAPVRYGKRLRVYYALQVRSSPITIRMFVNDPKTVTQAYTEYMRHAIRSRFGLDGAPIVIFFKARSRPESVESRPKPKPEKPGKAKSRPRRLGKNR